MQLIAIIGFAFLSIFLVDRAFRRSSQFRKLVGNTPVLGLLIKAMSRYVDVATSSAVYFIPYLDICHIPTPGKEPTESERAGYKSGRLLHQYQASLVIENSGDRFQHIFQAKNQDAHNSDHYRIFILGGSVAYGHGAPVKDRYYSVFEEMLDDPDIKVIPAGVNGIISSQENILLHLAILPLRPDFVILINGWNDIGLPAMMAARPGDPMNISSLYRKHYDPFFNLALGFARNSSYFDRMLAARLHKDRLEFVHALMNDQHFRESYATSIINIYFSNLETMMESCRLRSIPVLHVLQPCGEAALRRQKSRFTDEQMRNYAERANQHIWTQLGLDGFIYDTLARIEEELKTKSWSADSISYLDRFSPDDFSDSVHFNVQGHRRLGEQLFSSSRHLLSNHRSEKK